MYWISLKMLKKSTLAVQSNALRCQVNSNVEIILINAMFFQGFLSNVLVSKSLIVMTPKCTVSIKSTGFKIFKIFLLNVPYDLKNFPLCNYKTSTYNRNHRVCSEK